MGFMDKVKGQASQALDKASEVAKDGQAKMQTAQAKMKAEGLLKHAGILMYLQSVGRVGDETDAQIQSLLDQVKALEAEHGDLITVPTGAGAGDPGTAGA